MAELAAELNAKGVSVQHRVCDQPACAACILEVLEGLERYLALPGTLNSSNVDRHFLRISASRGSTFVEEPKHRRDFVLPLSPAVDAVLRGVLSGSAGAVLSHALGQDAEIYEITAIISEPGGASQDFHSDGNWSATAPRCITMFLALHDVLDEAMGPTRFCLETHAPQCFPGNKWLPPTATLVSEKGSVWYPLSTGDAVLMDSTAWHCGGANESDRRRNLLSVTFRAPSEQEGEGCKLQVSDFRTT
eukprot:gene14623-biopygen15072